MDLAGGELMPWPKKNSGANRQIGETQRRILERAAASPSGQMVISPEQNADWCAAKRLTQRGLLNRQKFGAEAIGFIVIYEITERGRQKLKEVKASLTT